MGQCTEIVCFPSVRRMVGECMRGMLRPNQKDVLARGSVQRTRASVLGSKPAGTQTSLACTSVRFVRFPASLG